MGIGSAGRQADKPQSASPFSSEDRVGGSMREIQLTQGQVALVDDEDFEWLNQWKWFAYASKTRKVFYAARQLPRVNGKQFTFYMHHEIIGRPPKGFEVDHRNGRGTDNQRHNLRHVTRRQNCQNRKNVISSSKYPGVSWYERGKKWQVHIVINGTNKYLGRFVDEEKAFEVYCQAVEAIGEEIIEGAKNIK